MVQVLTGGMIEDAQDGSTEHGAAQLALTPLLATKGDIQTGHLLTVV